MRTAIVKRERKVQIERRGKGEDSHSGEGKGRTAIVGRDREGSYSGEGKGRTDRKESKEERKGEGKGRHFCPCWLGGGSGGQQYFTCSGVFILIGCSH